MTFYQSFSGSGFDPVFPGSYDERIQNFGLPQEHRHSFHTYLPNLGSVGSQNVDLNYYPISATNVPYPSISGETGIHVPYANHAAVPNRFQSGPWTNMCNGETYCPMPPPEHHGQLLNSSISGCYNMIGNLVKPDPAFSGFSQPGHEYIFGCNAGWNQQPSDMRFVNSGNCMVAHPPQMQDRQFPAYWQPFQHKEIVNSGNGDSFAVPRNFNTDEMVQNTVVSSAERRCEDSNTFGIQPFFVDDTSMQQPTFSCYSPHTLPCDLLEPSLDSNSSLDTLFDITDLHTEDICDSELESTILQSLAEIPSLVSTDFVVTSSSSAIVSLMNEVQANNIDTISTAACRSVTQAVPEVPQSGEKPVTAIESINTFDELCTAIEVTGCDQMSSQYSSFPKQTSSCESSAVIVSDVESCSSLNNAVTAGSSVTSTRMQFNDCQLQTDSSENSEVISAAYSAPVISSELNVASKCVISSQELVPGVIIESDVGNCEPTDAAFSSSDDVILLSPSSTDDELTTPVSANVESKVKTQYCSVQPASVTGHLTFDHELRSVLRPVVPQRLDVRLPHAVSNTVRVAHHGSSVLLPLTYRNFGTCRNHGVLPSSAKHIANHCQSIQMTSQRHLPHSAVTAAQQASCCSAEPLLCKIPVTHHVPAGQYSAQKQQRPCLKPSSLRHSLSEPKRSNTTLRTGNCCDSVASTQRTSLQKFSLQSSQPSRHLGNAWHNNHERVVTTTQNASFISSTVSHTPLAVRTNPKQSLFTNQKSYSLLRYSRDGSSLRLQDMSRRKNETYSVRAASILLQRIKQAKLTEIVSAHAARQHLLQRRLNSVLLSQNREVIDLTGDDDDGGEAYTDDTCEFVFARTRRRRTRRPLLRRPRPYFHRTGTLAGVSSCDTNVSMEKTFAVDKSLPFYRCFVQNLLRNFRFTSSGVPVKVWYQEILPPAVPNRRFGNGDTDCPASPSSPAQNFEENADMSETAFSKIYTKELLMKRQPIVLLKRLDQSELNKYGVFASGDGNEVEKCVDHAVSESDDASQNLLLDKSVKDTETAAENLASTDDEQESIMVDEIERENVAEENVATKQTQHQLRLDELLALCRPVSVVLEHLDRIKIRQIDKELCKDKPNESILPTGSECSVSDLRWTVTQIPRANKVPILVMRVSSLSALNASRKKVTKKPYPARQLRSNFRCLRTRSCDAGTRSVQNLTPESVEFNNSNRSILKKIPACRKLHFPTSVWGRKNAGHILRRRLSASEERSPCGMSSSSQPSNSQSSFMMKSTENTMKTCSILAKPICKLERLASSVEQVLLSDSTRRNSLTDSIPYDFVVNQSLPEHCRSSDRSTLEFLPHSLMDANSTSNLDMNSGNSGAFPKNLLRTDSLPNDTNDLREDYASSGSNTVVMSPYSSADDLTIAYRSPISNVFDDDDDLAPDQQESLDVSLEAGNGSEIFGMDTMDIDQELKPTSYPDIEEVASQPYTATISESAIQSFSSLVKLSTFSAQCSCGTATVNALNTRQLQPTPVMLIESVNHGLEQRPTVNSHLSEFVDEDRRWLYLSLRRLS